MKISKKLQAAIHDTGYRPPDHSNPELYKTVLKLLQEKPESFAPESPGDQMLKEWALVWLKSKTDI